MSKQHRRATLVGGAILTGVLMFVLAACAPSAPTPSAAPSQGGTAAPAAAPTPTPTPTTPALPVADVRVPFGCSDAAPDSQLASALGTTVKLETATQQWTPQELRPYAFTQDGALNCLWSSNATSNNATTFQLTVMPDVTPSAWASYAKDALTTSDPASPFGGNSNIQCESSPGDLQCNLDAYIGTTWLSITDISTKVATSLTTTAALARFKPVFTTAVNAVTNATIVEPPFSDADATPVNYHGDVTLSDSAISAASGVAGLKFQSEVWGPIVDEDGAAIGAFEPVNFRWEGGGGGSKSIGYYDISVEVLPAGAWAFPQIVEAANDLPQFATLNGVGTQAITYSLSGKYQQSDAIIEAVSGHNLFSIEVYAGAKPIAGQNDAAVAKKVAQAVISGIGS